MISPLAQIESGAVLADDVKVGPFAVIEAGAVIGPGCELAAHAIVRSSARLAARVRVDSFAVVGGDPQDLTFDRAQATLTQIGEGTILREHVTVHRGTAASGQTQVGANCLLMAGAHVAHDCRLEEGVILANGCMLGGHVEVGQGAFISGGVAVHQWCRVGAGSMTSGNAVITGDVPPQALAYGRDTLAGLNLIGLRRRAVVAEAIAELKQALRQVYTPGTACETAAQQLLASGEFTHPITQAFLTFFLASRRHRFIQPES